MIDKIVKLDGDHSIIKVIVSTNANKNEISGIDKWREGLIVKINEKPVQNKANTELIRFFSDLFSLRSNKVGIIKGKKSREKTLRLKINKSEAIIILGKVLKNNN